MNPRETKFILRAHRGDGRYAPDDPLFAEALAETDRAPELAAWLAREHALDATVANKLDAIHPPAALRETILAGARASRLGRRWWYRPSWLAAAAALVLVALGIAIQTGGPASLTTTGMTEFALHDVAQDDHDHATMSPESLAIANRLSADGRPIPVGLEVDFAGLKEAGCARFQVSGREVLELCIERNGVWYHLYATRLQHPPGPLIAPTLTERGQLAVLTWTVGDTVFSLATNEGPAALRKVV